jgi:hypothetical protein
MYLKHHARLLQVKKPGFRFGQFWEQLGTKRQKKDDLGRIGQNLSLSHSRRSSALACPLADCTKSADYYIRNTNKTGTKERQKTDKRETKPRQKIRTTCL